MKILLLVPFALSALFMAPALRAAEAEVGKPAPNFTLPGGDGKMHELAASKGKIVVLEWTNPDCPFVKKFYEKGDMPKLQKDALSKGVVWYRINSGKPGKQGHQTAQQIAAYDKSHNVAATASLIDADSKVALAYGAKTTPHMYVINAEGVLVYAGGIDDKPSPKQEDIAGAKNYVTQALEEIAAGKPVSHPTSKSYGCGVKY